MWPGLGCHPGALAPGSATPSASYQYPSTLSQASKKQSFLFPPLFNPKATFYGTVPISYTKCTSKSIFKTKVYKLSGLLQPFKKRESRHHFQNERSILPETISSPPDIHLWSSFMQYRTPKPPAKCHQGIRFDQLIITGPGLVLPALLYIGLCVRKRETGMETLDVSEKRTRTDYAQEALHGAGESGSQATRYLTKSLHLAILSSES